MGRTSAWAGGLAVALVTGVLLATPVPAEPDDWREVSVGPARPSGTASQAVSIAVDGSHPRLAYEGSGAGAPGLTFAACNLPPCDEPARWGHAVLSRGPATNPSLVVDHGAHYLAFWEGGRLRWGECGGLCDSAADWQMTDVATIGDHNRDGWSPPRPSVALDAWGRPRIGYVVVTVPPSGTLVQTLHLASCEQHSCTDRERWRVAAIGEEPNPSSRGDLSLAYDGTRPRLVYTRHPSGQGWSELVYLACEDHCLGASSWRGVELGSGRASVSMAIHSGTIGIAFLAVGGASRDVGYTQCGGGCLEAGSWSAPAVVSSDAYGWGPEMAFTESGAPRVAIPGGRVASCDGGAACATAAGWETDQAVSGVTPTALAVDGERLRVGYVTDTGDDRTVGVSFCNEPCGEPGSPKPHPERPAAPSTSTYPPGEDPRDRRVEQFQTGAGSTSTSSPSTSTTATSQPPDGEAGFRWSVRRSPRPPASAEALTPGDPEFWLRGPGRKVVPADHGAAQGLPGRGDDQPSAPIIETDGATVAAAILALILAGVGVGVRLWVIQPLVRGRREASARP